MNDFGEEDEDSNQVVALYDFDPSVICWPLEDLQPLALQMCTVIQIDPKNQIIIDGSEWVFGHSVKEPDLRGYLPKNYTVTVPEYREMILVGEPVNLSKREVSAAFKRWDENGDGVMERSELAGLLQALHPAVWSDKMVDDLFEIVDSSANGVIEYDEFVDWVLSKDGLSKMELQVAAGRRESMDGLTQEELAVLGVSIVSLHEDYHGGRGTDSQKAPEEVTQEPTQEGMENEDGVEEVAAADEEPQTIDTVDSLSSSLIFGPAAFCPLRSPVAIAEMQDTSRDTTLNVKDIMEASVAGVATMKGERGSKCVTQMLSDCYCKGLYTLGSPESAVNKEIIPAMHHIFKVFSQASQTDSQRVSYLTALAYACLSCQQVQAREILRTFGDLTSQSETFEGQLRYTLVRQKETALHVYISCKHPSCDGDHTEVQPWQQRTHLLSGYLALIGEEFGFDGVAAALGDRFLPQVKENIGDVTTAHLQEELLKGMSVKEWLQTLLADINNQSPKSDRLIDRNCIFNWVQSNMSAESAYLVFYDEGRSDEFQDLDPKAPTPENEYQPFLSPKVLVDMLLKAEMLARS